MKWGWLGCNESGQEWRWYGRNKSGQEWSGGGMVIISEPQKHGGGLIVINWARSEVWVVLANIRALAVSLFVTRTLDT